MFPDQDIHRLSTIPIGCIPILPKPPSSNRQPSPPLSLSGGSIDLSRPALVARISRPIIAHGRIVPDMGGIRPKDLPMVAQSGVDPVDIVPPSVDPPLLKTIDEPKTNEETQTTPLVLTQETKVAELVPDKDFDETDPQNPAVEPDQTKENPKAPTESVEDEWELLVKHQQKLATLERQQDIISRKSKQKSYRDELLSQIERNRTRTVCESYAKKELHEKLKKREEEFEKAVKAKKEEEKRLKEMTKRFYDQQMGERGREKKYVTERGSASKSVDVGPHISVEGIPDSSTAEQQLYRKASFFPGDFVLTHPHRESKTQSNDKN